MDIERVEAKIFSSSRPGFRVASLIPVFHRWIREQREGGEMLLDVADYSHVAQGPGVLLIGHGFEYAYDLAGNEAGLLFRRKRGGFNDTEARLVDALERLRHASGELSRAPELEGALHFHPRRLVLRFLDKLRAPNDDATLAALAPLIARSIEKVWAAPPQWQSRVSGEGEALAIEVALSTELS